MIEEIFKNIDFSEMLENVNNFCLEVLDARKHRFIKRKIRYNNTFKYRTYVTYNPIAEMIPVELILYSEQKLLKNIQK